jgi:hypothetical protein
MHGAMSVSLAGSHFKTTAKGKFLFFIMMMMIIISGSTVLVRTLAASHWRFRNLIKTLGMTPLDE